MHEGGVYNTYTHPPDETPVILVLDGAWYYQGRRHTDRAGNVQTVKVMTNRYG